MNVELLQKLSDMRDECALRQNEADNDSDRRYWEGKRDGFDVALWAVREAVRASETAAS